MILVTCDTHCYYDTINQQIAYAEDILGHSIECVIHLGDFGIYKTHLKNFFITQRQRFKRPLYFIDGNHEDFESFMHLVEKFKDFFTYLPRATVHHIAGYRFLALGGAAYIDSMITEPGALITDQQINTCLTIPPDAVDIILTHDCPIGIGVPNTPGFHVHGPTGFPRSNELIEHFKPKLWLFGHHHKWFSYKDDYSSYIGLSDTWKGFGLLDQNYEFIIVKHKLLAQKTPFIEKLLMKLKLIRPDYPPQQQL